MSPFTTADYQLDTLGLRCPEPVMLIRGKMRQMQDGEEVINYRR